MSLAFNPPPPPPPLPPATFPQMHHTYTTHGSIGAVIGVLAVVLVLGALAIFVGRLCFGRGIMGQSRAHYDMETWVETKCSSCVDGRVFISPPQHPPPQPPPPPPPAPDQQPTATDDGGPHQGTAELPHQNVGSS